MSTSNAQRSYEARSRTAWPSVNNDTVVCRTQCPSSWC